MLNIKNIILEPYDWSTTDKSTSIVHRCLRGMLVDGDKSVLLKAALVGHVRVCLRTCTLFHTKSFTRTRRSSDSVTVPRVTPASSRKRRYFSYRKRATEKKGEYSVKSRCAQRRAPLDALGFSKKNIGCVTA